MAKEKSETSKEKWNDEGREFVAEGNTAEMDQHLADRKTKMQMGIETTHKYKRR